MNILYLSCHGVLEYDELKLLSEFPVDIFSLGYYSNPKVDEKSLRPTLNLPYHKDLIEIYEENKKEAAKKNLKDPKEEIDPRLIEWADVIIVMHIADWIIKNWAKMKKKRVIWRSIGQSTLNVENLLLPYRREGLEIIRYSPRERTIPNFVGEDAMIRFYKDENEFGPFTGEIPQVITLGQSLRQRDQFCNFSIFEEATRGLPRKVYGNHNEDLGELFGGTPSYDELKEILRKSQVFFYTGTYPASYTLGFIEAWMSGIPIVALGPKLGNSPYEYGQMTYEVADLINNTGGGLVGDDVETLRKNVIKLLESKDLRDEISQKGRAGAIKYFGKKEIKEQWKKFLKV